MRTVWTFNSAGQIVFGTGAVRQLGDIAARLGLKRILIVTDARLVEAGVCHEVEQPLAGVQALKMGLLFHTRNVHI